MTNICSYEGGPQTVQYERLNLVRKCCQVKTLGLLGQVHKGGQEGSLQGMFCQARDKLAIKINVINDENKPNQQTGEKPRNKRFTSPRAIGNSSNEIA